MKIMEENRIPLIDMTQCVKCYKCINTCPHNAIVLKKNNAGDYTCTKCVKYCLSMEVTCKPEDICIDYDICDSCGKCVEVCREGAISWLIKGKKAEDNL